MLARFFVFAGLVLALMLAIKDGRVLRSTGLLGSCHAVSLPAATPGGWQECREGKLDGFPDLSRSSCQSVRVDGTREWWACPLSLDGRSA